MQLIILKHFQNLIIPGFESHFENEDNDDDDEAGSDVDHDAIADYGDDESFVPGCDDNQVQLLDIIKVSFDNIAANNESYRIPCFAHTLQLVMNDGLKHISCVQPVLEKVSKIAKLSHTSTSFADRLEIIGKSIPKGNKTR